MSKKTKETVANGRAGARNPRTAVYTHIGNAISDVIKQELTEPQLPTRISDIKLTGLKTALGNVNIVSANIDTKSIIKTLKANADKIKAFIKNHKNLFLSSIMTYRLPRLEVVNEKLEWVNKNDYKELVPYFKKDNYTVDDDTGGEYSKYTISGFKITDYDGLIEAIKNTVPQANRHNIYDINQNSNQDFEQPDFWQPNPVLLEFSKLARHIGVEPSGDLVFREIKDIKDKTRQVYAGKYTEPSNDPNIITTDVRESDHLVYIYILYALIDIKDKADKALKKTDEQRRARANLKDGHDGLPRPATTTLCELFESAIKDDNRLIKMYDDYRTPEALQEAGGYKVRATQNLLPIFKASNDYKTLQAMIRANIPQLEKVLITLLREAQRTGGLNTELRWSRVADLAKPMYETQIAKRGKLDTKYKQAYVDNIHLLDALQFYNYEKPSKRNKGGGIYTKFKFIEIKKLDVNKKGIVTAIEWQLSDDFVKLVPYLIFVNTDNFLKLQNPHAQMLATYINDSFVKSAKRTDGTIEGLPITISAKTLANKAGLSDSNTTDRYKLLTEILNDINTNDITGKWVTENGDTVIKSQNNKVPKVVIYPSQNVSGSYISKRLDAGEKQARTQEQAKRQAELQKLLDTYRKDLKNNKHATEYKEALAEDLGTTTGKIDLMLLKPSKTQKPDKISDEMLAKIRELQSDYEGN